MCLKYYLNLQLTRPQVDHEPRTDLHLNIKYLSKLRIKGNTSTTISDSSCTWFLVELEFGNVDFWGAGKPEYPEKNLSA